MPIEAYHGVTAAVHQSNFNRLFPQGYRIISLSVYGDPGDPRYAAVWVQRQGPPWVAVHGVNSADYQAFFNKWTADGFVPVLVSATGLISNAIFAAVFEQGIVGTWMARHGMASGAVSSQATFQGENAVAAAQGMILRSFAIYGSMSDRRYAAIWHPSPGFVKWHVHPSDTVDGYQLTFNTETQLPGYALHGYRPAYVALSGDQIYCSVFKDDVVGPWVARHGMTSDGYQVAFNQQLAAGFYPICVQGGGSGSNTRYAAVFATQDIPLTRRWTVTGAVVPKLAAFDTLMQQFMQTNTVRAAQLTIANDGRLKFARAYTWAEPGYRVTQPSDVFLLASLSKMFTAAAIQALYDGKQLTPATTVYPLLGFSHPADARSDAITIQELIDHTAGYDDSATGSGFDPTYSMREIGLSLTPPHVVAKLDIARFMYMRPLDFAPGSNYKYSNYGYLLLSIVVERVTGKAFFDYVNETLLQPEGITEVLLSSTLAAQRAANEAICEDEGLGLSPLDLSSPLLVPAVYGGDQEIKEVAAGCAGLAASATALVQFIHRHAVWGNGGRAPGYDRSGSTPGTSTWARSRTDGTDYAIVINTCDWPPQSPEPTLHSLYTLLVDQLLDTTPLP